jgi:hypothetical protein
MADNVNSDALSGQILPSVYFNQITLKESGDFVAIDLNLSIKDVIEQNSNSSWFFNSDFTKYLQIKIIQITDEEETIKAGNNPSLLRYYASPQYSSSDESKIKVISLDVAADNYRWDASLGTVVSEAFNLEENTKTILTTGERVYEIDYKTYTYMPKESSHLTLFAVVRMDLEQMAEDYGISFGDSLFGEIRYEVVIERGETNMISYVYYLQETNQIWTGPIHRDSEGNLLTGQPEKDGSSPPGARPVRSEEVINPKINDLREADKLERNFPDLTFAFKGYQKAAKSQPNRDQQKNDVSSAYFSEAFITPSRKGDVGLVFHVDTKKLIREQSAFGSIFDSTADEQAKERMYQLSTIKEMKIFRRRVTKVDSINKLGTPVKSNIFDQSRNISKVLISSADADGVLESKTNDNAILREFNTLQISNDIRTFAATDKEMMLITDGEYQYGVSLEMNDGVIIYLNDQLDKLLDVKKRLDAYYNDATSDRYIEKDGTFSPLLNRRYSDSSPWNEAIATFLDVYRSMVSSDTFGIGKTPKKILLDFFQSLNETGKVRLFDSVDRDPDFAIVKEAIEQETTEEEFEDLFKNVSRRERVFERVVDLVKGDRLSSVVLIQTMNNQSNSPLVDPNKTLPNIPDFETRLSQTEKLLYSMINPVNGTEEGVYAFVKVYYSLIDHMQKILTGKRRVTQTELNSTKSKQKSLYRVSTVTTENFFKDTHDSDFIRDFGIDYLGTESRTENGPMALLHEDIGARVRSETDIYWRTSDLAELSNDLDQDKDKIKGDASGEEQEILFDLESSLFSYLTPASIFAGGFSFDRLAKRSAKWDSTIYDCLAANMVAVNSREYANPPPKPSAAKLRKRSANLDNKQPAHQNAVENIISQLGLIVEDPEIEENLIRSIERVIPDIPVGNILGSSSSAAIVTTEEGESDNQEAVSKKLKEAKVRDFENKVALGNIFVKNLIATNALSDSKNSSKVSNYQSVSIKSLDQYDLFSSDCVLEPILDEMGMPERKVKLLRSVPNQIRSLMFYKSRAVKLNWRQIVDPIRERNKANPNLDNDFVDPFKRPETTQMMKFSYDTIGKVMVLVGFEKGSDNENLILKPRFEPLTRNILANNSGNLLMCKIEQYKDEILGIGTNSKMNMPIYNKVFMLSPTLELLPNRTISVIGDQAVTDLPNTTNYDEVYATGGGVIGNDEEGKLFFGTGLEES